MRYYRIEEDKQYTDRPMIINWHDMLDVRDILSGRYGNINERMLLRIKENPNTVFCSILTFPVFLVSRDIKDCLKLYEPNLYFKEIILLDKKNRKSQEYFLPSLTKVQCLTSNCKFNMNHSRLEYIEINSANIKDKSIFLLAGVDSSYIIARLDVVESILRRKTSGIMVEEVNCVEGG